MSSKPMKGDDIISQDDEVKRAAEIREWIEARISDLEQEVSRLRDMLLLVDGTLRRKSFVSAKELRVMPAAQELQPTKGMEPAVASSQVKQRGSQEISMSSAKVTSSETRELRRSKDGEVLANATVSSKKITIAPSSQVRLSSSVPPFQSFFVNRILKGYQSKDIDASRSGSLAATDVLQFNVKEVDGYIAEVTVTNYRDKSRLNEILSTATWAFARMLEKK